MTPTHPAASMPASGRVPRCSCIMACRLAFHFCFPVPECGLIPFCFSPFTHNRPRTRRPGRLELGRPSHARADGSRQHAARARSVAALRPGCDGMRPRPRAGGGRRGARGAATGVRHAQKRENTSLFNARVLCDAALTLRHDASLFGMTLLFSVLSSVHHPACSRVVRLVLLTLRHGAPAAAPGRRMAAHTHGQPRGLGLGGARGGLAAARSIAAGRSALCAEPAA